MRDLHKIKNHEFLEKEEEMKSLTDALTGILQNVDIPYEELLEEGLKEKYGIAD